ncbi:MAG: hypothetical protein GY953_07765 [bacterium]|nr:hypothetical protein [bacterium]
MVEPTAYLPGNRVLLHAHNCYPYSGKWADRIDRALSTGTPLVIEQDLIWFTDPESGESKSVVAHECPCSGEEPGLKEYFFERVRPIVEQALESDDRTQWPLIVLHIEFKTHEPEHLAAVWRLLGDYQAWLTTAPRTADPAEIAPLDVRPMMVVTEYKPEREQTLHDDVPVGQKLRVFGAVKPAEVTGVTTPPRQMIDGGPTNYRRWWNSSWHAVEEGGAREAGDWTGEDNARLKSIVDYAHDTGIWVRFYCLNGHDPGDDSGGWGKGYNFGSLSAATIRWRAARAAGVDWIATDQYEELANLLGPR